MAMKCGKLTQLGRVCQRPVPHPGAPCGVTHSGIAEGNRREFVEDVVPYVGRDGVRGRPITHHPEYDYENSWTDPSVRDAVEAIDADTDAEWGELTEPYWKGDSIDRELAMWYRASQSLPDGVDPTDQQATWERYGEIYEATFAAIDGRPSPGQVADKVAEMQPAADEIGKAKRRT